MLLPKGRTGRRWHRGAPGTARPGPAAATAARADAYWDSTEKSYAHYPTVRHRIRFIVGALRRHGIGPEHAVFDYGCGEGTLLATLQRELGLSRDRVGGCDISRRAVGIAAARTGSAQLYAESPPRVMNRFDAIICSEVVEHTPAYRDLLRWMSGHLAEGGLLVLTTQSGRIHASDRYAGHTQHFRLSALRGALVDEGLVPLFARAWGWPLFTLQKYATDLRFDRVRAAYLEGQMTARKRLVFDLTHAAYFVHDLIPFGPQLYVVARKRGEDGLSRRCAE
jgi:SAM-dependent methyltransferase